MQFFQFFSATKTCPSNQISNMLIDMCLAEVFWWSWKFTDSIFPLCS